METQNTCQAFNGDGTIFGVDPNEPVTPIMVRDAIVECFTQAHKDSLELGDDIDEETTKQMIIASIKKQFSDTGGEYEHPTKESLQAVIESLKEFAGSFRNTDVIENHYLLVKSLIDKL